MGPSKRDGFYKRGKFWWTRDPVTRKRVSTHCTDLEAARRWRAARERIAADPAYAAAEKAQLGEWISRWLAMKSRTASAATMSAARQKLGHWVRVFGAEASLATVGSPAGVDRFVEQRRGEEVSDHTVSKEFTHIVAVLKFAKRAGCFSGDLDVLRPDDLHAGYEPRKRALTRAELAALLSELEPQHASLVAICVALGCRLGEAMRLLPTDIEADRVLIRGTKTASARRYVPILSLYRPLLGAALPYLPLARWDNVRRGIERACKRAGIERCTPNDLRRTHSTLLVEAGVDRDVVRRLLGHTTTTMVDRVYGQPKVEALSDLAEGKLLGAAPLLGAGTSQSPFAAPGKYELSAGASYRNRTDDLRFTNPSRGEAGTPGETAHAGNYAGSAPASPGEHPPQRIAAGTGTSQRLNAAEADRALGFVLRIMAARIAAELEAA